MSHHPKHLTWTNLCELHKANLKDEEIFYTWKADGYTTKITFGDDLMLIKIYDSKREILSHEIEPIDISDLNLDIEYNTLSKLVLYGECTEDPNPLFLSNKILFMFDMKYKKDSSYSLRHSLLSKIINKLKSKNTFPIEILVKEYSTKFAPINQYCLPGLFEYEPNKRCMSDGIIIYYNTYVFKLKYVNTFDVWIEINSGKLFTDDNKFIGYLGPTSNCNFDSMKNYQLIEVSRQEFSNYYKFEKNRSDKKSGDRLSTIKKIDNISPYLIDPNLAVNILNHIPKMRMSKNKQLTFEYRLLKDNTIETFFRMISRTSPQTICWMDIGAGTGHELNTFVRLMNRYNNMYGIKLSHKIYLLDKNINKCLLEEKLNRETNLEFLNNINIIESDITSSTLYKKIPKYSLDLITIFLSVKDFNQHFFRNINRWLKPGGKIAIIFYESQCIPTEGLFNISYNFGLKHYSDNKIKVYRNGQKKWIQESKLNIDLINETFISHNYKPMMLINSDGFDNEYPFISMLYGVIFKRHFDRSWLYDLLSIDIIQTNISYHLNIQDQNKIKNIFPNIKWNTKEIDLYSVKQSDNIRRLEDKLYDDYVENNDNDSNNSMSDYFSDFGYDT